MQHPTHRCLQVRNAHEAHVIMEAVRLGRLPMITRRLSTKERQDLVKEGACFVWEESDYRGGVDRGGIERWTDGLKWSQSRMHEPFLLYEEKADVPKDDTASHSMDKKHAHVSHCHDHDHHSCLARGDAASRARRQSRPNKADGLTKQTYSALLTLPGAAPGAKPCKWHLTCYFRRPDHVNLGTVDKDPVLREIRPTPGLFVTAKGLTRRKSSAASLDPADDALSRIHPGGTGTTGASAVARSPTTTNGGDSDTSTSPVVTPQSPYDARWGSPWSGGSSAPSVTSASPLTPPAYGLSQASQQSPPSSYPGQHGYYGHYNPHYPAHYAAQYAGQPPPHGQQQYGAPPPPSQSPAAQSPNCTYHIFAASPRESTTLPPIRRLLPELGPHGPPAPPRHAATGLGVPMPSQPMGSVSYSNGQPVAGSSGVAYDPRNGYYVERGEEERGTFQ